MALIRVCPECGTPGLVLQAVEACHQVSEPLCGEWFACLNPGCRVACFQGTETRPLDFFLVPLWYKDGGEGVPVCYCSMLTRGEIRAAVAAGCRSAVEVRRHTGKVRTGNCLAENPLGGCCDSALEYTIRRAVRELEVKEREPELPFF